jgi:hypothetical protein
LATDGRWAFDEAPARALVAAAWGAADVGAAWRGEAVLAGATGSVATAILALDPAGAALVGPLRSESGAALPYPGEGTAYLAPAVAAALHTNVGDTIDATADAWPESRFTVAWEMENVRACGPSNELPLCELPPELGASRLRLELPPRSTRIEFVPDPVELGPRDLPAFWNGSFTSPGGRQTGFATAAIAPGRTLPPGRVAGDLEGGAWAIEYRLEANGTAWPGARAGIVTYRSPGFAPFDFELLHAGDADAQLRAALANASGRTARVRVAAILAEPAGAALLGAGALIAPADARAVLGARSGEATMLLTRAPGDAAALAARAQDAADARLQALRARDVDASSSIDGGDGGALVLRAPSGLDVARLPLVEGVGAPRLALGLAPRAGSNDSMAGAALPALRILTLPSAPPWELLSGHWADAAAAAAGIAQAPNLVLASADLVGLAGIDPRNATYTPILLDGALGPQTSYVMGVVDGGPLRTIWVGAPLLAAMASPDGARVIARIDPSSDVDDARARALAAWAPFGVAPLVTP